MEPKKDNAVVINSLTAADVEMWLDDHVDWLSDYLQRRKSVLGRPASQSRHTVPTQCRGESTPWSPWNSRPNTIAVDAVSEHMTLTSSTSRTTSSSHHHPHQQLVQRGVSMPSHSPDYMCLKPFSRFPVTHLSYTFFPVSVVSFLNSCSSRHSPDYSAPSSNLFILTSDSMERHPAGTSLLSTSDTTTHGQTNSKKHLRRHFARSRTRLREDHTSEKSSASFDGFVSHALLFVAYSYTCNYRSYLYVLSC